MTDLRNTCATEMQLHGEHNYYYCMLLLFQSLIHKKLTINKIIQIIRTVNSTNLHNKYNKRCQGDFYNLCLFVNIFMNSKGVIGSI